MQCSETKRLTLAYELLDILIPEQNYQRSCPERTELQLLHFGLLGDSAEVIKLIIPSLDFYIVDSTLNELDRNSKTQLALSIGSNHYSKLIPPYEIKFVDNILLALTNQVNHSQDKLINANHVNLPPQELIYNETIKKITTKFNEMTPQNMYDEFTILTAIINLHYNDHLEKQNTSDETTTSSTKTDDDELANIIKKTNKKSPGRPPKNKTVENLITDEDATNSASIADTRKSPGRPKKTIPNDSTTTPNEKTDSDKRKKGRPPTKNNKRKRDDQDDQLDSNKKRKQGRPKKEK